MQLLKDIPPKDLVPGITGYYAHGAALTLGYVEIKAGSKLPEHHHVHEQVTQVIAGQMRFWFGADKEQVMDLYPGDVIVIPSNLPHEASMIGDVEEIDTWSPPRQDWIDKTDDYLRK